MEGVWLWRISGGSHSRWWGWLWRNLHVEYKNYLETKIILPLSFSFFRHSLVMHTKRTNKIKVDWENLFFGKFIIFFYTTNCFNIIFHLICSEFLISMVKYIVELRDIVWRNKAINQYWFNCTCFSD